ncbi:tyrosine-protein phosphatase Lar-like isoform X2 [Ornithodoros turicata]|uniref:tyrosine-protein phosphatase Lar-like isoform X2 n=1 Tax=Ornithodoros turicata TaxID=34597 RepID=UPI00313962D7
MGSFHVSVWAVPVFILMLWTTADNAHGQRPAKRAGPTTEQCLPGKLNVRVLSRPTEVGVTWTRFVPRQGCINSGALYQIVVKWQPKNEAEQEATCKVEEKHFDVTGLKPDTPVTITVYLSYTDANGANHLGPETILETSTVVGELFFSEPSAPRNFTLETLSHTQATFVWEDPEVPGGLLDGYAYKVCEVDDCDSEMDCVEALREATERHKLTVRRIAPNQHYRVKLAAYNILKLSQEVIYGNYSSYCFKAEAPSPIHPRDLHAECKANPNSITLTWKLPPDGKEPDSYVVEITGSTQINKDIAIKDICQGQECKYSVDGVQGGITYEIILVAKVKDTGADSAFTKCRVAESAPPPPTQDIKLVYDPQGWWVTPKKTQQAFQFPTDLFSNINGHIDIAILIAQDSKIDDCENPVAWKEANSKVPVPCYILQDLWVDGDCKYEGTVVNCTLGTREECDRHFCNGPLKVGVKYGLKLRGITRGGETDSKPVFFTAGSPPKSRSSGRTGDSLTLIGGVLVLTVFMMRP